MPDINKEYERWTRDTHGMDRTPHKAYIAAAAPRDELLKECYKAMNGAMKIFGNDPGYDVLLSRLREKGYGD